MLKAFINLDLIFRQNLFPKLVIAQDNHDLGLKTSIQIFGAFVRCTLLGNQPWPQFQSGIRERSVSVLDDRLMSQSIPTGYISPPGNPGENFCERANPPGWGKISQTRRNCSVSSLQKSLTIKKTTRQQNHSKVFKYSSLDDIQLKQ